MDIPTFLPRPPGGDLVQGGTCSDTRSIHLFLTPVQTRSREHLIISRGLQEGIKKISLFPYNNHRNCIIETLLLRCSYHTTPKIARCSLEASFLGHQMDHSHISILCPNSTLGVHPLKWVHSISLTHVSQQRNSTRDTMQDSIQMISTLGLTEWRFQNKQANSIRFSISTNFMICLPLIKDPHSHERNLKYSRPTPAATLKYSQKWQMLDCGT